MIEDQVRALFTGIADGEPAPSRVDTGLAHRRGMARLRWRRAGLACAPVLAAAAVAAVALAVGAAPFRPGPAPAARPPAVAPSQFNPLVPYASFGWLPPGDSVLSGTTYRPLTGQVAGPSQGKHRWALSLYPAGYCRLTAAARGLACTLGPAVHQTWRIIAPAPAVVGHRAFWADPDGGGVSYLVWQYAKGGWATLGMLNQPGTARHGLAVKIADHVRYGAHAAPPLAFPARVTGLPAGWRVAGVSYIPDGAVSRVTQYLMTISFRSLIQFPFNVPTVGLPEFRFGLAGPHGSCPSVRQSTAVHKVIDGYRVILGQATRLPFAQWLCAPDADGLQVAIGTIERPFLSLPDLFAHHLHLLGTNPANWARTPSG
jgi:hypothetical protein